MNKKYQNFFHLNNPFFALLASNSHEALIILDRNQQVILFNPAAEQLFECDKQDVEGLHFDEFCKGANFHLDVDFNLSFTGDKKIPFNHSGNQIQLTWLIEFVEIENQSYFVLLTKNLVENKQQNEINRLNTLIENIPANVYWIDKNCLMLGCNHNVLATFNMTYEQFCGKTHEEIAEFCNRPKDLAQKFKNDDLYVLQTGQPLFGIENPAIFHANNTHVDFLTNRAPLYDNSGEIVGLIGVSVDITNLKNEREQAQIANNAKTDFIANMCHDIRTPLTGIIGLSRMLVDSDIDEQAKQYSRWVNESGGQLLKLLNGVLDVVSADNANEIDLHEESFNLPQLVQDIFYLERPSTLIKGLDLVTRVDKAIPTCLISDPTKIHRILLNLLGNAIKFTEKGRVEIDVVLLKQIKSHVLIEFRITDTGIGIPYELQNKVFDRFYKATPSDKGTYTGHGVGLHIAQSFVELLGGELQLNSEPGAGTTFSFELSLKIDDSTINMEEHCVTDALSAPLPTAYIAPSSSSTGEFTISEISVNTPNLLLVEDNKIALFTLENIITQAGYRFTSVMDGEKALYLAKTKSFDLIITDLGLPGLSGIDLTLMIRAYEKECKKTPVPIIGLTAHSEEKIKRECLDSGMNDVYTKPMTTDVLATIRRVYFPATYYISQTRNRTESGKES